MGTTGSDDDRGPGSGEYGRYVAPIRPGSGGSGRSRWLVVLAGFLVLVGIVVVQRNVGGTPAAAPGPPTPSATTAGAPSRTAAAPVSTLSTVPPTTVTVTVQQPATDDDPMITPGPWSTARQSEATSLATSALPKSPGWEIVGYGQQGLVRIDPATGRVWLVNGPEISDVTGYQGLVSVGSDTLVLGVNYLRLLIPDGGPAHLPQGLLASALEAFPGPDPDHLWVWTNAAGSGEDGPALQLVNWREQATRTTIGIPDYVDQITAPVSDGDGYVLVRGIGGTYDARPDGLRLVTTGEVIAAGPTGYLAYECGARPGCTAIAVDRRTGARRTLGATSLTVADPTNIIPGQISPDGSHAAYLALPTRPSATADLHLVDMTTGKDRILDVFVDLNNTSGSVFGFSSDGRYLAVAALGGAIDIVDTSTGAAHALPRDVPPVQSLVTRFTG